LVAKFTTSKLSLRKFGGDATLIGDEGGLRHRKDVESGLQMIMEAAEAAGYVTR
jgi:enolase